MAWERQPLGFTRSEDQTTQIPTKSGSYYTAGTLNTNLGNAIDGDKGTTSRYLGWLLMKSNPLQNECGKLLYIDYAVWGGAFYFDFTAASSQHVSLYFQFYSMLTGRYDSHWTHFGDYQIGRYGGSVPSADKHGKDATATTVPWSSPSTCYSNAPKPAYGLVKVNGVDPSKHSTYNSYADACAEAGGTMSTWDGNQGYAAYARVWPYGVRYISNNGYWGYNKTNVNGRGVIHGDYDDKPSRWNQTNEDDGGNNRHDFKTVKLDEAFIVRAHGTLTGVTAFRMKWVFHGDYWCYPNSPIPNNWVMIDNPRIGLLDWGAAGSPTNWPPRYDAKPWYRNGSANKEELQARYNPGGSASNWQVF